MITSTECEAGREDDFNRLYDEGHVPEVLEVPGIVSARRYQALGSVALPGGRVH